MDEVKEMFRRFNKRERSLVVDAIGIIGLILLALVSMAK